MSVIGTYPDAEVVAAAWIMSIPGLTLDLADYQLPWDLNVPVLNGYVQLTVIGGPANQNVPIFTSMLQVDCWVEAPSEDRVFRMQASAIAKQIQYATWDRKNCPRGVTPTPFLSSGTTVTYANAHVSSAYVMQEPHKIQSTDNPMYEGYSMDMMFTWSFNRSAN